MAIIKKYGLFIIDPTHDRDFLDNLTLELYDTTEQAEAELNSITTPGEKSADWFLVLPVYVESKIYEQEYKPK